MKNKKVYGLVGVAALAAVGGTFAYYSAEQTFTNPFKTTYYNTQATEKFNPSGENKEWKPGAEIDKDVYATNTGDGEVWVRVKFDEEWSRTDENGVKKSIITWKSEDRKFNTDDALVAATNGEKNQSKDGTKTIRVKDENGEWVDKTVELDDGKASSEVDTGSVVYKGFEENEDWIFNPADGYYYYKTMLRKGESTSKLLDYVTLCGDADMGSFVDKAYVYVTKDKPVDGDGKEIVPEFDGTWEPVNLTEDYTLEDYIKDLSGYTDEEKKNLYVYTYKENVVAKDETGLELNGYADADYDLNITVEFVQADEDYEAALAMGWPADPDTLSNNIYKYEFK